MLNDIGDTQNLRIVLRTSWLSVGCNVLLALCKLLAGLIAHSGAMISDALHSASDVLSTFVVMIGARMGSKKPDTEHPYGHERMECIATLVLSISLFVTGVTIGYWGVTRIMGASDSPLLVPGKLALFVSAAAVVIKEYMYWFVRSAAKKAGSSALMADAWHHRVDAFASVGSFIGVLGARLGIVILDPIASIVICLFIVKTALGLFQNATHRMTDAACDSDTRARILCAVRGEEGVLSVDTLRTRLFGERIYVEIEIGSDARCSLPQAHEIAQRVHDAVERDVPGVKHCMVYVRPHLSR